MLGAAACIRNQGGVDFSRDGFDHCHLHCLRRDGPCHDFNDRLRNNLGSTGNRHLPFGFCLRSGFGLLFGDDLIIAADGFWRSHNRRCHDFRPGIWRWYGGFGELTGTHTRGNGRCRRRGRFRLHVLGNPSCFRFGDGSLGNFRRLRCRCLDIVEIELGLRAVGIQCFIRRCILVMRRFARVLAAIRTATTTTTATTTRATSASQPTQ